MSMQRKILEVQNQLDGIPTIIRKFHSEADKVESGPVQIGEDWPGTFIRGDDSFVYAMAIKGVLEGTDPGRLYEAQLGGLLRLLCKCNLNKELAENILNVKPKSK